jgi:uncharacterized protein YegJ (DUF2314 family)
MRCSGRALLPALFLALLLASCERRDPPAGGAAGGLLSGGAAKFVDIASRAALGVVEAAGNAIHRAGRVLFGRGNDDGGGAEADGFVSDPTLHLNQDDEALNRIAQNARDTLPVFFRRLLRPAKGESNFRIKYPFKTDPGSGFGMEQLWLSGIDFRDGVYYGVLSNTPYYIASIKRGDTVSFSVDEITDWMYIKDGKIIGGLSIRHLLEQIPEHERSGEQRALLEMFE